MSTADGPLSLSCVLAADRSLGCRANERDVLPRSHIEELEALVTPRQGIVVVRGRPLIARSSLAPKAARSGRYIEE